MDANTSNIQRLLAIAKLKSKQVTTEMETVTPLTVLPESTPVITTTAEALVTTNQLVAAAKANPEVVVTATKAAAIDNYVLHEAIANLSNLILTAHPTLPVLLRTIHKQLREDPELVTILSEDEVGIIVNGLKKVTNTEIAASTVKSSTTAKLKKKGTLNVDMF